MILPIERVFFVESKKSTYFISDWYLSKSNIILEYKLILIVKKIYAEFREFWSNLKLKISQCCWTSKLISTGGEGIKRIRVDEWEN